MAAAATAATIAATAVQMRFFLLVVEFEKSATGKEINNQGTKVIVFTLGNFGAEITLEWVIQYDGGRYTLLHSVGQFIKILSSRERLLGPTTSLSARPGIKGWLIYI